MSAVASNATVVSQLGETARNVVAVASGFIKFALQRVVQLLLSIALPLSLALLLLGLTLYFTHLNRRMGRDFIVLSVALAFISQLVTIERLIP